MVTGEALAFHAFFSSKYRWGLLRNSQIGQMLELFDDDRREGDLGFSFLPWRWALDLLHRVDR
jgi:hypothetical protein